MIIGGSTSQDLAAKVANILGEKLCYVETKKFPDGERYLKVNGPVEDEVTIIQSTAYPQDENILELLFLIKTVKDLGAKRVKVVMPYMGYARQEKRFNPGEAVSARIVAELIECAGADEFITFNIHEKCVLDFFSIPAKTLSAMPAIAEYVRDDDEKPLIVAPDKGAYHFAQEIAHILDSECTYFSKVRLGPDKVETRIVDVRCDGADEETVNVDAVKGKKVVIIDDIIATGGTIVNAINILKQHGAKSVDVCCVHPILVNGATARIYEAGANSLISTNSISSDTSRVSLADIIAEELKD
ncbi:MAG: ribose-phosphate diphosphokinase [Methanobrevibacter sp.]|uniref:ribose-phosphate diphosphokinase n=1 Tax=Methanobrevibacter sp. TaxID=66852 RepID=UPI0026DFAA86|nr:ribose-phosphate diphosphokinase [Methanobrevibacter sp.]MDO5849339.1 ribose-phosphate diphosphokinase [Methanobrevibacter sp.]